MRAAPASRRCRAWCRRAPPLAFHHDAAILAGAHQAEAGARAVAELTLAEEAGRAGQQGGQQRIPRPGGAILALEGKGDLGPILIGQTYQSHGYVP
jgi:hypothetical protein